VGTLAFTKTRDVDVGIEMLTTGETIGANGLAKGALVDGRLDTTIGALDGMSDGESIGYDEGRTEGKPVKNTKILGTSDGIIVGSIVLGGNVVRVILGVKFELNSGKTSTSDND
jgi:hypothetical protein